MRALPTLRQLRYLVALAEQRHFARAAEDCLVTQSTLSAGIRELEEMLGVVLIDRSRRQTTLSPAGEEVVVRARALLRAAEELVDAAHAGGKPLTGLLRLGVIPTIAPYLLPRALPAVRAAYPKLRLYLREEQTGRVLELLGRGRLDAGLIALPYATGDLRTLSLGDDPLRIACPQGHPFAVAGTVGEDELAQQPLLLLEDGHCLRDHALTACHLQPGQANEDFQATSLSTLVQMVASGLGLTLVPELAVDVEVRREPGVTVVPFARGRPSRQIALVWPAGSVRGRDLHLLGGILRPFVPCPDDDAVDPSSAPDPLTAAHASTAPEGSG
jgi:LysR family transcriptional regulator, hydrogen peroxide-inducible genes activator